MEEQVKKNKWVKVIIIILVYTLVFTGIFSLGIYFLLKSYPSVRNAQDLVRMNLAEHYGTFTEVTIPSKITRSTISIEDRRFYEHHGLDLIGLIKTTFFYAFSDTPSGGATITEQLAKNLYVPVDVSWKSKVEIAGLAVKLESVYTKNQILTMYLNEIYYGNHAYGIYTAAKTYFQTTPDKLTWAEASLLAGLPQAPSYYNPLVHTTAAKERQRLVLNALVRSGYMTSTQADHIYQEVLPFVHSSM